MKTILEQNLSYNEREALAAIQKTGSYSSTRHNDRTKALEGLIRGGYPIKREVVNKALMVFTWQAPAHIIAAGMEVTENASQVVTTPVLSEGEQHFLKTWGKRGHVCLNGSFKIFSLICLLFLGAAFASCSSQEQPGCPYGMAYNQTVGICYPVVNTPATGWKIRKITSHAYGTYGYYYTKGDSIRYIQAGFSAIEIDHRWDGRLYGKNLVSR